MMYSSSKDGNSNNNSNCYKELIDMGVRMPTQWNAKDKCKYLSLSSGCAGITAESLSLPTSDQPHHHRFASSSSSSTSKSSSSTSFLETKKVPNSRVRYAGTGRYDSDAASVRANAPIPKSCAIFYFENTIISKGRDGYIGIGICSGSTSLSRLPGWDINSFGYHGDDGLFFKESGSGSSYGPLYTTGDVIGCCVNYLDGSLSYTKNGLLLGKACTLQKSKEKGDQLTNSSSSSSSSSNAARYYYYHRYGTYYPVLGMRTHGETVDSNFGSLPFLFNFSLYRHNQFELHAQKLAAGSLKSKQRDLLIQSAMPKLILEYLLHHSYTNTAKLFCKATQPTATSTSSTTEAISSDVFSTTHIRRQIEDSIRKGSIEEAQKHIATHFPTILTSNRRLSLLLKCHRFLEIIQKENDLMKAVEFGRAELAIISSSKDYQLTQDQRKLLQDIFAVLCYKDPTDSSLSYLFEEDFRIPLLNEINSSIMVELGLPSTSTLEKCLKQAIVVRDRMIACDMPFISSGYTTLDYKTSVQRIKLQRQQQSNCSAATDVMEL